MFASFGGSLWWKLLEAARLLLLHFAILATPGCEQGIAESPESQATPHKNKVIQRPSEPIGIIIGTSQIKAWLLEYRTYGTDFGKCNDFAFRCSHYGDLWFLMMSSLASDPATTQDAMVAMSHIASAFYCTRTGPSELCDCLNDEDAWVVAGQLKLLRTACELKPDGSDRAWPSGSPLGATRLPRYIIRVLDKHPELAVDVCLTLERYGPFAQDACDQLLPLLLCNETEVVDAATSAIRQIDPDGLYTSLELDCGSPLPQRQRALVQKQLESVPHRNADADISEVPEYNILRKYVRTEWKYGDGTTPDEAFELDQEEALRFQREKPRANWWNILSTAYIDPEMRDQAARRMIPLFASAIYFELESQADVLSVLHSQDSRLAESAMYLIWQVRAIRKGRRHSLEGDLVSPDVMPAEFVKVLQRHPHLYVSVAKCMRFYGKHAVAHVNVLTPHLLSEDVYVVNATRAIITRIDPALAENLGISLPGYLFINEHYRNLEPLTPQQRDALSSYLERTK